MPAVRISEEAETKVEEIRRAIKAELSGWGTVHRKEVAERGIDLLHQEVCETDDG